MNNLWLRLFHLFYYFFFSSLIFGFWLMFIVCCFFFFFVRIFYEIVVVNLAFNFKVSGSMGILKHQIQICNILCDVISNLFKLIFFFDVYLNYFFILVIDYVEIYILFFKLFPIRFIQNVILFRIDICKSKSSYLQLKIWRLWIAVIMKCNHFLLIYCFLVNCIHKIKSF